MIKGVGVDIVSIARMRRIVEKWDSKFLERFFTEEEVRYIYGKGMACETISGNFATKEAVSKVLGTGLRRMKLKDIELVHDKTGQPRVRLYGGALSLAEDLGIDGLEVSISHERDYVVAMALGYGKKSLVIDRELRSLLPRRDSFAHKGSFGRLGIIAGSKGMLGSNYLATMAGLRTGAGLVYSIVPESLMDLMAIKLVEAIVVPLEDKEGYFSRESIGSIEADLNNYDSLVIGPGLGYIDGIGDFVEYILKNYRRTLLIDADGLNIVGKNYELFRTRPAPTIISPHPGEFARLLGIEVADLERNRLKYAVEFSKTYGLITVLKGHETLVTDGDRVYVNNTGNPGMATAGSGDLLSGIIASLLAQGLDPFDAGSLGVYIHGLAGDICRENLGEYGMIARDILDCIPEAISLISSQEK